MRFCLKTNNWIKNFLAAGKVSDFEEVLKGL